METYLAAASRHLLVLAALGLVLQASCSRPVMEEQIPEGATVLQGAGATFPDILYQKWIEEYAQVEKDVVIRYDAIGSGGGIDRFIKQGAIYEEQGDVDFAGSDAAISGEDASRVERGVQLVPMTAGGIVLAYNLPGLSKPLKLSREAYAGIFLGEIKKWNDKKIAISNPGEPLPNRSIVLAVRKDSSGTTFAFTKHLSAVSSDWNNTYGAQKYVDWPGNAMRGDGNAGVAGLIKTSPHSIGYIQQGFAEQLDLPMAHLENKSGNFIEPSFANCQNSLDSVDLPPDLRVFIPDPAGKQDYPIVTLTWILAYQKYEDADKANALKDFLAWGLDNGQSFAEDLGYVPLPAKVVTASKSAVDSINP